MTEVHAIVFDLDGTLPDHRGAVSAALHQWLPEHDVHVTEEIVAGWLAIEQTHIRRWRRGELTWQEQRRRRVQDFLPMVGLQSPHDRQRLDSVFAGYLRHYEAAWRVFDDVMPVLTELSRSGARLVVLTNGTTTQQQAKVRAVGLEPFFEWVSTAEELGTAKPDPSVFLAVAERLGWRPDMLLHVGDDWELDVIAARPAGMRAVQIDRSAPQADRDRITDLHQLLSRVDLETD